MYRGKIIPLLLMLGATFAGLGLTACAPEIAKETAGNMNIEGRAPVTPHAVSETPTPPSSELIHGVAPGVKCQDLFPLQSLYEFNPNFSLVMGQSPVQPAVSSPYENLGGITCNYMNQTSGEVIQVSLAKISENAANLPSSSFAKAGNQVPSLSTAEMTAYFEQNHGNYIFRLTRGSYILAITSTLLLTPNDNFKFIGPVLSKL